MIHGSQKLKHLDFSIPTATQVVRMPNRGRNKELLSRRNGRIISRYYFWNAIKGIPVAKAIETLIFEFDLDSYTLSQIINKNGETIHELRKKKPSAESLKKQYHWPTW